MRCPLALLPAWLWRGAAPCLLVAILVTGTMFAVAHLGFRLIL
jgi:hypothetical protein